MLDAQSPETALEFPPTTRPEGATPAVIGAYAGGRPLYLHRAEGTFTTGTRELLALQFPDHTPGQLAALVEGTADLDGRITQLTVAAGGVSGPDLAAIGEIWVRHLILGTARRGPDVGAPLEVVDGADLSGVGQVSVFEAHAVDLGEGDLGTLPWPDLVQSLTLDTTPVTAEILTRFTGLEVLALAGVDRIANDLSFVEELPRLEFLGVRFGPLTVDRLGVVGTLPEFRALDIGYNPDLGPDLTDLPSRSLEFLDVSTTAVDDSSLATLNAPRLDQLSAQCTAITDAGLDHLPSMLTRLNLAGTRITDHGLGRIAAAAPNLTELDLRAVAGITPDGLRRWLPALEDLTALGVSSTLLDRELALELDATTGLEHLMIGIPDGDDGEGAFAAIDIIGSATFIGNPM